MDDERRDGDLAQAPGGVVRRGRVALHPVEVGVDRRAHPGGDVLADAARACRRRVRRRSCRATDAHSPSSSGIPGAARDERRAAVSGATRRSPPAEVAPSTRALTRPGCRSASSWATIPPKESP